MTCFLMCGFVACHNKNCALGQGTNLRVYCICAQQLSAFVCMVVRGSRSDVAVFKIPKGLCVSAARTYSDQPLHAPPSLCSMLCLIPFVCTGYPRTQNLDVMPRKA